MLYFCFSLKSSIYLFVNFIFEEREFLPLTRDYSNCWWWVKTRDKTIKANSIILKNSRNEQSAHYAPEISRFIRCYDYGMTVRLQRIFPYAY